MGSHTHTKPLPKSLEQFKPHFVVWIVAQDSLYEPLCILNIRSINRIVFKMSCNRQIKEHLGPLHHYKYICSIVVMCLRELAVGGVVIADPKMKEGTQKVKLAPIFSSPTCDGLKLLERLRRFIHTVALYNQCREYFRYLRRRVILKKCFHQRTSQRQLISQDIGHGQLGANGVKRTSVSPIAFVKALQPSEQNVNSLLHITCHHVRTPEKEKWPWVA